MEFAPFYPDDDGSRQPVWGARLDSGLAEFGTAHCNREGQWVDFRPAARHGQVGAWLGTCGKALEVEVAGETFVSNTTIEEMSFYPPKSVSVQPEILEVRVSDPVFDVDQWGNLLLVGVTIAGRAVRLSSPQTIGRRKADIERYEQEAREWDAASKAEQERKNAILNQLDTPGRVATIVTGILAYGRPMKRALRRALRDDYLGDALWWREEIFTTAVCTTIRSLCPEIDWELYDNQLPNGLKGKIVDEVARDHSRFAH